MIKNGKSTLSLFRRFAAGAVVAVACSGIAIGQQQQASDYWADWPEASKKAAAEMYEKYGEPDGVTEKMVIWNDAGPWKTTTVYKDPVPHNFPKPHKDVLEQTVNYEVPTDKIDELVAFDGSVFAKRTSGVVGTTCDKEPMSLLTLNLAHDIIVGKKDVAEARASFGEIAKAFMQGEKHPYTQKLQFDTAREAAGDPGEAVIDQGSSQKK